MKKKIRVLQYGVGPIGTSIVRLMRQKNSLEIVGAIDKDPAKAGRDLGEVVGATDTPWGVPILPDARSALEKPAGSMSPHPESALFNTAARSIRSNRSTASLRSKR